ncbi:hypothetical protein BY996DRAFT_6408758 [Phakopsora pachyrhizi]|nr:hypothetical protein BY996DRAFT_6408758 [Phakopsora pachyrhizi]
MASLPAPPGRKMIILCDYIPEKISENYDPLDEIPTNISQLFYEDLTPYQSFVSNVESVIRFLSVNYRAEDEIFFFGYALGASVVQFCASFILNAGLILPHKLGEFHSIYSRHRKLIVAAGQINLTQSATQDLISLPEESFAEKLRILYMTSNSKYDFDSDDKLPDPIGGFYEGGSSKVGSDFKKKKGFSSPPQQQTKEKSKQSSPPVNPFKADSNKKWFRNVERVKCVGLLQTQVPEQISKIPSNTWEFYEKPRLEFSFPRGVEYGFHGLAIRNDKDYLGRVSWKQDPINQTSQTFKQAWFHGTSEDIGGLDRTEAASYYPLIWLLAKIDEYRLLSVNNDFVNEICSEIPLDKPRAPLNFYTRHHKKSQFSQTGVSKHGAKLDVLHESYKLDLAAIDPSAVESSKDPRTSTSDECYHFSALRMDAYTSIDLMQKGVITKPAPLERDLFSRWVCESKKVENLTE